MERFLKSLSLERQQQKDSRILCPSTSDLFFFSSYANSLKTRNEEEWRKNDNRYMHFQHRNLFPWLISVLYMLMPFPSYKMKIWLSTILTIMYTSLHRCFFIEKVCSVRTIATLPYHKAMSNKKVSLSMILFNDFINFVRPPNCLNINTRSKFSFFFCGISMI